jgi:ribosomal protein S18 acetylase RimI-like enzyme
MADLRHSRPEDWERLKALRLRALLDSPDAGCPTYEEAAGYGDHVWMERSSVDPAEGTSTSILAFDRDEAVGLAVGVLCDDHRLDVVSVFVTPSHRGSGIAHDLMDMVETWGKARGARVVVLDVEASNERAGAFYAAFGYLPTGRRETYPGRVWLHRLELTKSLAES